MTVNATQTNNTTGCGFSPGCHFGTATGFLGDHVVSQNSYIGWGTRHSIDGGVRMVQLATCYFSAKCAWNRAAEAMELWQEDKKPQAVAHATIATAVFSIGVFLNLYYACTGNPVVNSALWV